MTASLALAPEALRPTATRAEWSALSFAAGLAACDALDGLTTTPAALKWPNDVLVGGAKIAGLLVEAQGDVAVVGVGLNIVQAPLAASLDGPACAATCLADHLATDVDVLPTPAAVLDRLDAAFDRWIAAWAGGGFAALRSDWLARAHGLDRPMIARFGSTELVGRFIDLDADGALRLQTADGVATVRAGDVFPIDGAT